MVQDGRAIDPESEAEEPGFHNASGFPFPLPLTSSRFSFLVAEPAWREDLLRGLPLHRWWAQAEHTSGDPEEGERSRCGIGHSAPPPPAWEDWPGLLPSTPLPRVLPPPSYESSSLPPATLLAVAAPHLGERQPIRMGVGQLGGRGPQPALPCFLGPVLQRAGWGEPWELSILDLGSRASSSANWLWGLSQLL